MLKPARSHGFSSFGQRPRRSAEGEFVYHHVVGDPVDCCRLRGNGDTGVVAAHPFEDIPLRRHAQDGELDDPVTREAEAGGLEVEEDDGAVEVEGKLHGR